MGNADWSLGQLEVDLAAGFDLLARAERLGSLGRGETEALAEGVLRCMNGALMKVSESLEIQNTLRRELAETREAFVRQRQEEAERIGRLEDEVAGLRQALAEERARRGAAASDGGECHPSDEYLAQPFVLRSQQGDFLGVTGPAGQALSLSGFLRLVDGPAAAFGRGMGVRTVASFWQGGGQVWSLAVSVMAPAGRRHYVLETRSLRTPSNNLVTLLDAMHVDGASVPREFLLQMFRQLRDSLQEN